MDLQINQFRILEGHTSINFVNEYEPDVLSTFCATRVLKLKFYKEYMSSLALLPPRNFAVFERQFLLQ